MIEGLNGQLQDILKGLGVDTEKLLKQDKRKKLVFESEGVNEKLSDMGVNDIGAPMTVTLWLKGDERIEIRQCEGENMIDIDLSSYLLKTPVEEMIQTISNLYA